MIWELVLNLSFIHLLTAFDLLEPCCVYLNGLNNIICVKLKEYYNYCCTLEHYVSTIILMLSSLNNRRFLVVSHEAVAGFNVFASDLPSV